MFRVDVEAVDSGAAAKNVIKSCIFENFINWPFSQYNFHIRPNLSGFSIYFH